MAEIPYEKQLDINGFRTCGAASLKMIYKSYGFEIPQTSIWCVIRTPDKNQSYYAPSNRLAMDAILRGFNATIFKAIEPISAIKTVLLSGGQVIMNHRLNSDTGLGHFTVALSIDEENVFFHDPEKGPNKRKSINQIQHLFKPQFSPCEITGNILVAITQQKQITNKCRKCGNSIPASIICPNCKLEVPIISISEIGCFKQSCVSSRIWQIIFCPFCDLPLEINKTH